MALAASGVDVSVAASARTEIAVVMKAVDVKSWVESNESHGT
jgi:hypothetical protein